MNSRGNFRAARGFTLIEVGIAITLAAIVLGGATAMLVGVVRTNDTVQQRLEQIAVRSRLSDRFRADVDAARSCAQVDEKQPETGILVRTDDEHSVQYVAGENDVKRIAMTGDHVDARETFYLGDQQQAILTISADSPPTVRCTIRSESGIARPEKPLAITKPRPALTIAAVLGRSRRLSDAVRQASVQPKADPDPTPAPDATPSTEPPAP